MSKRDDILNATLDLIHDEGLQSVTFSKIFKKANVGSGTLYNYFNNKEEIVTEIFKRCLDLIESYTLPDNYKELELIGKFNVLIDNFIDFMTNHEKEYLFLESAAHYHISKNDINFDDYYGLLKEFDSVIKLGQEQGIFRTIATNLCTSIVSGVISFSYRGASQGKYPFDDKCISEIKLSCWKSLLV